MQLKTEHVVFVDAAGVEWQYEVSSAALTGRMQSYEVLYRMSPELARRNAIRDLHETAQARQEYESVYGRDDLDD